VAVSEHLFDHRTERCRGCGLGWADWLEDDALADCPAIDSAAWTGRVAPGVFYLPTGEARHRRLRRWLYPTYECALCVGQEAWQGCHCRYHGAVAPGVGPERWRALARRAYHRLTGAPR
jgi:hypothetical protein